MLPNVTVLRSATIIISQSLVALSFVRKPTDARLQSQCIDTADLLALQLRRKRQYQTDLIIEIPGLRSRAACDSGSAVIGRADRYQPFAYLSYPRGAE